jgi:adenosylcobinamide kinase / adenosylcobinamide-phosphate guanylyltransferase
MWTLILGGARSGKSRFAQSLCTPAQRVAFVATARAEDEEMRQRIARHRESRSEHWLTVEEPLDLASAVSNAIPCANTILIDCLTLWLSNLMWENREAVPEEIEKRAFCQIEQLSRLATECNLIMVSNEVGGGLVPETEVGRRFRDLQGLVNQDCAARADRVFFMVAGIAVPIKPRPEVL